MTADLARLAPSAPWPGHAGGGVRGPSCRSRRGDCGRDRGCGKGGSAPGRSGRAGEASERGQQGSGTVLTVILVAAVVILLPAVLSLMTAYQAKQRARAAADLGAIAAVSSFLAGQDAGQACARAGAIVLANGSQLAGCVITPAGRATISTRVPVNLPIVGTKVAADTAHAGPMLAR